MSKVHKRNNEEKMLLDSDGLFDTWSSDECYCQVRIIDYVVTNLVTDNCLTVFFCDELQKTFGQANIPLNNNSDFEDDRPLEQLFELLIRSKPREEGACVQITYEELIGFECQFVMKREDNSFNVIGVFPKDEELDEYFLENTFSTWY